MGECVDEMDERVCVGGDQDDVWNMDCDGELFCAVERRTVR